MGLQALPSQQGGSRSGPPDVRGHRGVWGRTVAGGTDGGTQKQDVPTPSGAEGMDSEGGRQTATVGHTDDPRPRGANGGHARARSDLRGGLAARATRLPTWQERSGSDQGGPETAGCGLYGSHRRGLERVFRQHSAPRTDAVRGSAGQRSAAAAAHQAVAGSAGRGDRRTRTAGANDSQQGRRAWHTARRGGVAVAGEPVYASLHSGLEGVGSRGSA